MVATQLQAAFNVSKMLKSFIFVQLQPTTEVKQHDFAFFVIL